MSNSLLLCTEIVTDVRNILEVIHRKKVEKNSTLAVLFTKLKNEYPGEINLKDFCKWTAENPFIISPVLILQLHLRRQIIGEKFWAKLTEDRLEDPEMGDLGFIKRLQQNVIGKINEFKRKQEEAEREQERLRKRGRGPGADARDNISRKESKLLGFFHLRQPSKKNLRSTNGVLVDLPDHDDDYYDKPVESMQVNKPSLNSADVNKLPMDGSVKKTDKNGYISPTKDSKKGSSKKMKKESKGEVENKTSSSGKYSTTDKELNSEKNGESEKRKKKKKQNDVDPSVTGETAPIQTRRRRSIVKPKIVLSEYQVKRKED